MRRGYLKIRNYASYSFRANDHHKKACFTNKISPFHCYRPNESTMRNLRLKAPPAGILIFCSCMLLLLLSINYSWRESHQQPQEGHGVLKLTYNYLAFIQGCAGITSSSSILYMFYAISVFLLWQSRISGSRLRQSHDDSPSNKLPPDAKR